MTPSADPRAFDPAEDQRLVARCLDGDPRAWKSLVARYERLVFAVARGYRLSEEDLGDVFQQVFAALIRGLPRLREPRALCRWLSSTTDRIARTTALRTRREAARSDSPDSAAEQPDPGAEPPGADLERLEEQALVRLALDQLGERCQGLLKALYYEDPAPAYAALARRLGMPIGSLGPTRARCIERLQQVLRQLALEDARITPRVAATSSSEREGPPRGTPRPLRGARKAKSPPNVREA